MKAKATKLLRPGIYFILSLGKENCYGYSIPIATAIYKSFNSRNSKKRKRKISLTSLYLKIASGPKSDYPVNSLLNQYITIYECKLVDNYQCLFGPLPKTTWTISNHCKGNLKS